MRFETLLISFLGILNTHSIIVASVSRNTRKVHGQGHNPHGGIQSPPPGDYDLQPDFLSTSSNNKGKGHGNNGNGNGNGRGNGNGNANKNGSNKGLQGFVLDTELLGGIQSPSPGDYGLQPDFLSSSSNNKGNGHGNGNGRGNGNSNGNGNKNGANKGLQGFVLATESGNVESALDCENPNGPGNGHGKGHAYGHCRGKGNKFGPKRPPPGLYKRFAAIYSDVDRKVDGARYDEALENDEVNDDFNGRSIVAPGQYPHMAALGFRTYTDNYDYKCGGSLINEVFVLTVAHCCYHSGQAPEVVKVGDINLKNIELDDIFQVRPVAEIQAHPWYNSSYNYHDIALIRLAQSVIYTNFVRPIRLWVSDDIPYDRLHAMGYGSTAFAHAPTNVLTELELSIVPLLQCNQTLPSDTGTPDGLLESQICAKDFEKNRDTCQGDSGGPLQLNLMRKNRKHFRYYLIGMTSYGTVCRSAYPGVYTRVSSYIEWITSVVWPDYYSNYFPAEQ
ncbi:prostasin [Rhagoletis pomonella]|uniref:prostasin n=1 Tax=Rhagoletis pomonella TaxID=28610 RepID=UPI00177E7997|nr:prostasin [Rhagoletis pomonella]